MRWESRWLVALWLLAGTAGLGGLWAYANRPGPPAQAPRRWPGSSKVTLATEKPTLIVFIHPRCACTRATLGELSWILTRAGRSVAAHALIYRPLKAAGGWERTDLWHTAAALGVEVLADPDGEQARRFGAATSGTVVVYAPTGGLLYRGGITGERGHEGDNAGRRAVLDAVAGRPGLDRGPAFGCLLSSTTGENSWKKS